MSTLHFTVDSALLQELGEKLVETVHIALVELVKNSYDADASKVEIIFKSGNQGESEIHVIDNGKGMNFSSIERYWMRIATTNKEKADTSTIYGRPLTGAKGIGRFSCRRLGTKLKLVTVGTQNGNVVGFQEVAEKTEVEFPWLAFTPGTNVTEISCPGSQTSVSNTPTGTTLIISDISDEWNVRGWNWLKRQLGVLSANSGIQRKNYPNDPGFQILITAPDFEGGVRDIREDFINAGWGTLTAKINDQGQAECKLDALGIGSKTITSKPLFKKLKDVSLRLGIMVSDRSQMRDTSTVSLKALQQILPSWGGVQIRFKNFRVFPYGDDDWLDIDHDRGLRKRQPKNDELFAFANALKGVDASKSLLNALSMRNYLGSVNIGENAKGFEMKLNREGFLLTPEVEELKSFVRYAIDWATILREFHIRQGSQQKTVDAVKEFEEVINSKLEPVKYVEAAVSYIEQEVKNIVSILPEDERTDSQRSLLLATDVIKKHNESNKAELLHLRLVASTSTLLLIFSHEVKSLLALLEQSKNSMNQIASRLLPRERNEILRIASNFTELKGRLDDLLQLTSLVGANQKQAKAGQVSLKNKIVRVEKVFALIIKKYEIDLDYSAVPNNIVIKDILEAEVYSILLNILSNAIKSVIAAGKNRKIQISAQVSEGKNWISVRDTGIGLSEAKYEDAFVPFISDPDSSLYSNLNKRLNSEDIMIVGSGSGLGLGIVKEIINAHNGTVKFTKPREGWNAEIEIKI